MGLRENGKTVVISLLDKSDKLPLLEKSLRERGIVKLAVINSMTKQHKKRNRGNGYRGRGKHRIL